MSVLEEDRGVLAGPVQHVLRMRRTNALVAQLAEQNVGSEDGGVRPLRGRQDVLAAAGRLLETATREVRQFDAPGVAGRPEVGEGAAPRLSRGIRHRIITDDSVSRPARWGVEHRRVPHVPYRMLIADSHGALFGRSPEESLLVGPSLLLDLLIEGFESTWHLATPVERPSLQSTVAGSAVTEEERRLLIVMAAGATDQAISRQLHISVRTVQRRVRALMDRLEAGTRFQAGMNAAKRGWI